MSFYTTIKKALTDTVDAVVDKATTQAQKSRLVTVMKSEKLIADRAYIELGKYLYSHMSDDMPDELKTLCAKIDSSKERMSRAQEKYREVIQQELVNREINVSEAKENFRNIKEPIVSKAKDTADKAIDTAGKVKEVAAEKAVELKSRVKMPKIEVGYGKNEIADADEAAEEIFDSAVETAIESVINSDSESTVQEAIEQAVTDAVAESVNVEISERQDESENVGEDAVEAETEADDNVIYSHSKDDVGRKKEAPESTEIYSKSEYKEAAENDESFVPKTEPVDQGFQREVPVDIISEDEFEENEPVVKPNSKPTPVFKAMKLRKIITKRDDEN